PEIVRGDLQSTAGPMLNRNAELVGIFCRPVEGRVGRHAANEIRAFHARNRVGMLDEDVRVERGTGRDDTPHHDAGPQLARERSRVDVSDSNVLVSAEGVAKTPRVASVARHPPLLAGDGAALLLRTRSHS